ncbi:MAG TPA: phospholipase D-like domain-containing protein [Opitutaceae bacterium]|nr:phospholipase D-like domain-containing protein [Opitutaceae bacterium]
MPFRCPPRCWSPTGFCLAAAAATALFLAGCSGVPNAAFLKRRYSHESVQFRSAWGPIPQQTSKAILAELKQESGADGIVQRQTAIEQVVAGHPLVTGNRVQLLLDGPATYQAMFAALRQAKQTINVESYIIDDRELGQKFAAILLERRAAGVEVNVIYDYIGSLKTKNEFFDRLRAGGIHVLVFNPVKLRTATRPWKLNHRDHRKLTVIDGRIAFLGGINIDEVYAHSSTSSGGGSSGSGGSGGSSSSSKEAEIRSGWRDTDVEIEGPVVADFQRLFLKNWKEHDGTPLDEAKYLPLLAPVGTDIVRAIGSSPKDAYSVIYLSLMAAIINAQHSVYITNAYFVPDPQFIQALVDAAHRGVDVRLVLPSTTDSKSAAYAAHSYYAKLLNGGVKIYERQSALLHAKTAVIDGVWSMVGSANLDWRSAVDNDELDAVILSQDFAKKMIRTYAFDESQSDLIDPAQWKHRPFRDRVKETVFRLVGRLL